MIHLDVYHWLGACLSVNPRNRHYITLSCAKGLLCEKYLSKFKVTHLFVKVCVLVIVTEDCTENYYHTVGKVLTKISNI